MIKQFFMTFLLLFFLGLTVICCEVGLGWIIHTIFNIPFIISLLFAFVLWCIEGITVVLIAAHDAKEQK